MSTERGSVRTRTPRSATQAPPLRLPLAAAAALALACLPVSGLFSDADWAGPALLTIGLVCAVGGVLRALPVPVALIPLAQAAVFVAVAAFLLPPEGGGMAARLVALRDLVADGVAVARGSSAPVSSTPQIVALLIVAVFLAALLVENLAVGLGLAGLSGAVLLAMTAVPVGLGSQGFLLLCAPAAGWLLLMAAEQSASLRARGPSAPRGSPARGPAGLGSGAGLLAIAAASLAGSALVLAVIGPTPELRPWLLSLSDPSGSGGSSPAGNSIDPFVDVRQQLGDGPRQQEVLTYRSSDGRPTYLGMVTLELFNGEAWAPYPRADGPDSSLDQGGGAQTPGPSYEIRVSSLGNPYLPVPDYARTVIVAEGPGDWNWDRNTGDVVSLRTAATGLAYQVATYDAAPDAQSLAAAGSQGQDVPGATRGLPRALAAAVAPTAAEVTAGSTSNYDRALLLQDWFARSGGFQYSLTVPDPGQRDPVVAFLADRQGFCQQYATAMAVLARSLEIPARVVVGFAGGSGQGDGSFRVSGRDAHAWPELWFDDIGWVRFEPTPSTANPAVTPPAYASPQDAAPPTPTALPSPTATAPALPAQPGLEADGGGLGGLAPALLAGCVLGVLALIGLAAPRAVRTRARRTRLAALARGDALAAWTEIRDSAVDAGVAWAYGATTRQQAAGLAAALDPPPPGGSADWPALQSVVAAVEERLYAPAPDLAVVPAYRSTTATIMDEPWMRPGPDDLSADVEEVLRRLDGIPRPRLGRLIPRSVRRRARRAQ